MSSDGKIRALCPAALPEDLDVPGDGMRSVFKTSCPDASRKRCGSGSTRSRPYRMKGWCFSCEGRVSAMRTDSCWNSSFQRPGLNP